MNVFIKKILFAAMLLILMLGLDACSSSSGGEEEAPAATVLPAPTPEPTPEKVNPLTANRWCRAEDWDTFQVVMRMTLKESKMLTEYLLLTGNGFNVYKFTELPKWEVKGQLASEPNKVLVSLHESAPAIPEIPGFAEQKRIFTEIFSLNPNLSHPEGDFAPTKAMTTLTRSAVSGFEIERNVYPCESYSSTFNGEGTERPLMELLLLFGANSKDYTAEGRTKLANAMTLAFPINEVPITAANINDTQWCSWREVGPSELLLRTLTIGQDRFVQNAHSQIFANETNEEDLHKYLQTNAARSEKYSMAIQRNRLTGKNLTPAENSPRHPVQELITMVEDGNGTKALVRMDPIEPDRTWPVFSDIYFNCQDARPLQFSPAFQMRITEILDLQKLQLTSQPPPTP